MTDRRKNRYSHREQDRTIWFGDTRRMPASDDDRNHGIVGFKIEYDYKDTPADLARRMAELYREQSNLERDAKAFADQARSERQKASEVRETLRQIEQDPSRKSLVLINPSTGLPRRMNPYKEYSVDALVEEVARYEARADDFDATAAEARADLAASRYEMNDVQKALANLRG